MRTDGGVFEDPESECDDMSDEPLAEDVVVDDDSERDDDDQEGDDDESSTEGEDEELEREWAATEIQNAWKSHYYAQQQQQQVETEPEHSLEPTAPLPDTTKTSVCCSCFGLIEAAPGSPSDREDDDQAFCVACLYVMSKATTITTASITPGGDSVSSPLPKLSMLVQAEAKYQDQLQLLRAQRDLLRQQQQEMQNRKSAQAKQLAVKRALAREQRRLFQLTMERKKREEELKYHHQLTKSFTNSPEQEEGEGSTDGTMTSQSKPLNRTKKKVMKEIIPIPLRRTLLQQIASEMNSPVTHLPGLGLDKKTHHCSDESQEQHQQQRKTHFLRKMVDCYAQDLTPLVNGHKLKPLPTPSPCQPNSSSSSAYGQSSTKKSLQKSHKQQHNQQQPMSRASPHSFTKVKAPPINSKKHQHNKKKLSHPVRLHPIATGKLNNQHDELEREQHKPLYSPYSSVSSSPLTAEIKPISWVYELGKGVLDEELHSMKSPPSSSAYQAPASSQSLARFAQLDSVQEESDLELQPPSSSFDLRLQYKLPAKTMLSPSSPSYANIGNCNGLSSSSGQQPQWEYSTDRLASLLEKYNVSVTSTISNSNNSSAIK